MIYRSFSTLLLLTTVVVSAPVHAQNTQVTVAATVASKSDSRSAVQKARPEAVELAKKNAWFVFKKRPEFQQIVFNFEREQDQEMVSRLTDLCVPPVDIDQSFNKKLGQLTFRFRFECDQQALIRDAGRLNKTVAGASGGPNANQPRARLSGVFIAIKDDRVEEFDETKKSSIQESNEKSERKQEAKKEKGTWGESRGQFSESFKSKSVEETTETEKCEVQTSGSKVRQSAKVSRIIVSAQEIQRGLVPILQRDRFTFIPYGTVASRCGSVPFEQIQEEIRTLPADFPLAVRDATRDKVLQSTSSCQALPGIQYYVEGYAKIGAPGVNPATGAVRVSVNVSQVIYDVTTGAEVSSTPEKQVYGVGDDEAVATTNALAKAAELVGQTTVSNLSGLGI